MTFSRIAPTHSLPAHHQATTTNLEPPAAHGLATYAHGSVAASSSSDGDEIFHTETREGSMIADAPRGASPDRAPSLYGESLRAGGFRRQESFRDLTRQARIISRELEYSNIVLCDHRDATLGLATSPPGNDVEPLTEDDARALMRYQSKLTEQNAVVQRLLREKRAFGPESSLPKARLGRRAALHLLSRNREELGLSESVTTRLSRHPDVVARVYLHERLPSPSELVDLRASPQISLSMKSRTQSDGGSARVRGDSETSNASFPSFHYSPPETRHKGFPGD